MLETTDQLFEIIKPDPIILTFTDKKMLTIDFLDALQQRGLLSEAIRFLAIAIPKRQAISWTIFVHEAAQHLPCNRVPLEQDVWKAVRDWVKNPTESARLFAYKYAELLEFKSAGAYAGLAVFWSGGNMAPPQSGVEVKPPPALTGTAVGASILLSTASAPSGEVLTAQGNALSIGMQVATGNLVL